MERKDMARGCATAYQARTKDLARNQQKNHLPQELTLYGSWKKPVNNQCFCEKHGEKVSDMLPGSQWLVHCGLDYVGFTCTDHNAVTWYVGKEVCAGFSRS